MFISIILFLLLKHFEEKNEEIKSFKKELFLVEEIFVSELRILNNYLLKFSIKKPQKNDTILLKKTLDDVINHKSKFSKIIKNPIIRKQLDYIYCFEPFQTTNNFAFEKIMTKKFEDVEIHEFKYFQEQIEKMIKDIMNLRNN